MRPTLVSLLCLVACEDFDLLPDLELTPDPACEDRIVLDDGFGAVHMDWGGGDCDASERAVPNQVHYGRLLDRHFEPISDPNARVCNTGKDQVLVARELTEEQLTYDPLAEPLVGTIRVDERERFEEDLWYEAAFRDGKSSRDTWRVMFRYGDVDSAVNGADCLAD